MKGKKRQFAIQREFAMHNKETPVETIKSTSRFKEYRYRLYNRLYNN